MQAGTERPRFRQDLFAESVDEQGGKYVDIMDPDSGRVFRLYEVEFSIACAMDGRRDVPGLVKWAQDELGLTPTANEVQTVIATLGELGYLDLAAAADAPATSGLAAAGGTTHDTVVDAPALNVPASQRRPIPVEDRSERPPKAAAAPGTVSEVSLDLSQHLPVGKEDVQEAVRQSRVMAAVEAPPELPEPATVVAKPMPSAERPAARPTPTPSVERPAARPTPTPSVERPAARPTPTPSVERPAARPQTPVSQPPVEVKPPERPIEVKPPERPIEVKPERPVQTPPTGQKQPVPLPKPPEKQPVVPPGPERRTGLVLMVLLVLAALGIGAFFVWKLVIDAPGPQATAPTPPVQPEPPPPPPPPKPTVTAAVEMIPGPPETIEASFGGVIEWLETPGKEVKTKDVIVKMLGHQLLEKQADALAKELDKLQGDVKAAGDALAAVAPEDEAARTKAQGKVTQVEKLRDAKAELLKRKTDQLERAYVRVTLDGTLETVQRKVGERVPDKAPVATVVPTPVPSVTFKVPPALKVEVGTKMDLRSGEKKLPCEVAEAQPEKVRFSCPGAEGAVAGAPVVWQLP